MRSARLYVLTVTMLLGDFFNLAIAWRRHGSGRKNIYIIVCFIYPLSRDDDRFFHQVMVVVPPPSSQNDDDSKCGQTWSQKIIPNLNTHKAD